MSLEATRGRRSWRGQMNDKARFGGRTPDRTGQFGQCQLGGHCSRSAHGHRNIQARQLMRVVGSVFPVVGLMVVRFMVIRFMLLGQISFMRMPFLDVDVVGNDMHPDAKVETGSQYPAEKSHLPDDRPDASHGFIMVGLMGSVNCPRTKDAHSTNPSALPGRPTRTPTITVEK